MRLLHTGAHLPSRSDLETFLSLTDIGSRTRYALHNPVKTSYAQQIGSSSLPLIKQSGSLFNCPHLPRVVGPLIVNLVLF